MTVESFFLYVYTLSLPQFFSDLVFVDFFDWPTQGIIRLAGTY